MDLAIVALPLTRVDHEVEFLKRDEIFLVANRHHPVMKHARKRDGSPYYQVDLKDTAEYEYILSDYDTILGSISRREFKKAGVRVISHNSNITAAMGVAMAREGWGWPSPTIPAPWTAKTRCTCPSGEEGVFLDLALAHPYSTYQSRAALALDRVIRETV